MITLATKQGGLLAAWLSLYDTKTLGIEEQNYLAPKEQGVAREGDVIDAARQCLLELGWTVDDAKAQRPPNRRQWDCSIWTVLREHGDESRRELGLASFKAHMLGASKTRYCYLGGLLSISGTYLQSAPAFFNQVVPAWFSVLEEVLQVTPWRRQILACWCTAHAHSQEKGLAGSRAVEWSTKTRVTSAISIMALPADRSTDNALFRKQQRAYAAAHNITYESIADGTGGGKAAGFAWQVTLDLANPRRHLYREAGQATGLVRADTSELAGMVRQLQKAPDQPGARICSDCLGVLLMIDRASNMLPQRILKHAQRVLLREYLAIAATRRYPILLGWARGHTERQVIPYVAQRWCDDNAMCCARDPAPAVISQADGRLVLLNQEDQPILGSW